MGLKVVGSDSDVETALKAALETAREVDATASVIVFAGRDGPVVVSLAGESALVWLGLIEIARQAALEQATE